MVTAVVMRCGRRLWMSRWSCIRGEWSWKKMWNRVGRCREKKEEENEMMIQQHLHNAVLRAESNAVAVLLFEYGVDANARNQYGHTSLHIAALLGVTRIDACMLLLRGGADPLMRTSSGGSSSIDIARMRGEAEVAALLSLSTLYSV